MEVATDHVAHFTRILALNAVDQGNFDGTHPGDQSPNTTFSVWDQIKACSHRLDAALEFGSGLLRVDRSPNELHPWPPSPGLPGRSAAKPRL